MIYSNFTYILFSVAIALLVFIALPPYKFKKKKPMEDGSEIISLELSRDEFYKTLNFMMMYNIITFEQYNELVSKGLPYVKRRA